MHGRLTSRNSPVASADVQRSSVRDAEVPGSNPGIPTTKMQVSRYVGLRGLPPGRLDPAPIPPSPSPVRMMGWRELPTPRKDEQGWLRRTQRARLYADEDIEDDVVAWLRDHAVNIRSAREPGRRGRPDEYHVTRSRHDRRFLLTKNSRDFLDDRAFPHRYFRAIPNLQNAASIPHIAADRCRLGGARDQGRLTGWCASGARSPGSQTGGFRTRPTWLVTSTRMSDVLVRPSWASR